MIIKMAAFIGLMLGFSNGLAAEQGKTFLQEMEILSFKEPRLAIEKLVRKKENIPLKHDKKLFFLNFLLLNIYIKIGDLRNISSLKRAFELTMETDPELRPWFALARALIHFTFLNTEEARINLKPYFSTFEKTGSAPLKMWSSYVLGILHSKKNQFEKAFEHFNVANAQSAQLRNDHVKLATLKNLIVVFYYMRDYDRAEMYSEQLLASAQDLGDEFFVSQALSDTLNILTMRVIALNYEINDLEDEAPQVASLLERRKKLRERMTQIGEDLLVLTRRIGAFRELTKFLIARQIQHNQQGEFEAALALGDQVVEIASNNYYDFEKAVAINNKALTYQLMGKHEQAIIELEAARAIYDKIGNEQFRLWILEDFAKAYERNGDFEAALDYRKKYHIATMKLMEETNSKLVLEMQEELESDRKKYEIEELRQANLLKKSEIENSRLQLIILVSVVLLMLAIVLMQVSRHRVVSEKSRKLDLLNRQLRELSFQDPLTGLSNRRILKEIEDKIFLNSRSVDESQKTTTIGVVLIDIDHFKSFNDQYGHEVGDLVLVRFSQLLREMVSKEDYAIRWGGEEFLLILPNRSEKEVREFCEALVSKAYKKCIHYANFNLRITVSVGYSIYQRNDNSNGCFTWSECFKLVDRLLYIAKEEGRNRSVGLVVSKFALDTKLKQKIIEGEVGELRNLSEVELVVYSPEKAIASFKAHNNELERI